MQTTYTNKRNYSTYLQIKEKKPTYKPQYITVQLSRFHNNIKMTLLVQKYTRTPANTSQNHIDAYKSRHIT